MTDGGATGVKLSPYRGLTPYTEADAAFFFGRTAERELVTANLAAHRLTLLYGESGVGKSSLLRAGVVSQLLETARCDVREIGAPEFVPVMYSSWRDDPVRGLTETVRSSVAEFLPADAAMPQDAGFAETIEAAAEQTGARILVILDQFEEYFLYHPGEDGSGSFAAELPRAVKRPGLAAGFLIAIREDALAKLDQFEPEIAGLFDNSVRIGHLDAESGREAIEGPLVEYNRRVPDEQRVSIEPALVDALLEQVRAGKVVSDQAGRGALIDGDGVPGIPHQTAGESDEIETPYLQLVLTRLWDTETAAGSRVLRLATLTELGGAQEIVRTHLDTALADLQPDERDLAADLFHHLVTPSGTKIAHAAADLADYSGQPEERVRPMLQRLASGGVRIVRTVPPPLGEDGPERFEIFHDVLASAILDWRARQTAVRLEREREAAEAEARLERRRARVFRALATGALILLLVALIAVVIAKNETSKANANEKTAESRQLASEASTALQSGAVDRGALLSLEAYRTAPTTEARESLANAVQATTGMNGYVVQPPPTDVTPAVITSVAFSPDGKTLASADTDGAVTVLDAKTEAKLLTLRVPGGTTAYANSLAFSPDGRTLASGNGNGTVILWNALTGTQPRTLIALDTSSSVESIAFSPDGKTLALTTDAGDLILCDVPTGRRLFTRALPGGTTGTTVAFAPNGKELAVAGVDSGGVSIWDTKAGTLLKTLPGGGPGVAFSADGRTLAANGGQQDVVEWNAQTGQLLRTLQAHPAPVAALAISPDGKMLAAGDASGAVIISNANTGQQLAVLKGHTNSVTSVAFSPDGRTLASSDRGGSVILQSPAAGRELRPPQSAVTDLGALTFSADGRTLLTSGQYALPVLWDTATGAARLTLRDLDDQGGAVFSASGAEVVVADGSSGTSIWSARTGKRLKTLTVPDNVGIDTVAASSDGETIAAGSDQNTVILWNIRTAQQLRTLTLKGGTEPSVNSVAFSADGQILAAENSDNVIGLWNMHTGQPLPTPGLGNANTGYPVIAVSADGKRAATSLGDDVAVWNVNTGQRVLTLSGLTSIGHGAIRRIAFSPSGTTVAAASLGVAYFWDARTGNRLGALHDHNSPVEDVAFSADGTTIASGDSAGTVLFDRPLPSDSDALAIGPRLCAIVRRNLNIVELLQFLPGQAYYKTCPAWP